MIGQVNQVSPPPIKIDLNRDGPVRASQIVVAIPTIEWWHYEVTVNRMELSEAAANLANRPTIRAPYARGEWLPDTELMRAFRTPPPLTAGTQPVAMSIIAVGYASAHDHRQREARWCVIGGTILLWLVGIRLIVRRWRRQALAPWSA